MAMNLLRKLGGGKAGSLVWGGLAVLMVIGLILCSAAQSNEIDAQRVAAEQSAVHRVRTALFENLDPVELGKPILGPSFRDLLIVVQAEFMADPAIGRVRIWQPDGTLIFSTQERDRSVTADVQTRDMIENAIQGRTGSVESEELVAPGDEIQPVRAQMLKTITPIRVPDRVAVLGAAEVDTFNEHIEQAATSPWRTLRIVLGLILLVSIVMAFVGVRWPPREPAADVAPHPRREPKRERGAAPPAPEGGGLRGTIAQRRALRAEAKSERRRVQAEEAAAVAADELSTARADLETTRQEHDGLREQLDEERIRRESVERDITSLREQLDDAEATRAWAAAQADAAEEQPAGLEGRLSELEEQLRIAQEHERTEQERARDAGDRALQAERRAEEVTARLLEAEADRAHIQDEFLKGSTGLEALESRVKSAERRARQAEELARRSQKRLEEAGRDGSIPARAEPDPASNDLRARLARTSASKKPGGTTRPSPPVE